ncbi:MAG: baseplate J/gp47 family protein [Patescibacteria group bacterium]
MSTTSPATLTVLSPDEISNSYLRVVRAELISRGVANPNVTPGSDYAVRAAALAQQISPAMANAIIAADINMPDMCTAERLVRWLAIYGLSYRDAQGSVGNIVHSASSTGYVPHGAQLVNSSGLFYEVDVGGNYPNGASIPIRALSTGKSTNMLAGETLQWLVPPPYANSKVLVGVGGLIDGVDADTDTIARNRLLQHLRTPTGGGNWAQTIEWAVEASASVVAAFDYPALLGPSSYAIWPLGALIYDTTTGFSRQLSDATRAIVKAAVVAQKPPETYCYMMTTLGSYAADIDTDVVIALSLPAAISVGGEGGGWTDATPWPVLEGGIERIWVDGDNTITPTQFVLRSESTSYPRASTIINGVTQIAVFDPVSWWNGGATDHGPAIRTSTIVSHAGIDGSVVCMIDPAHPFPNLKANDMVFPNCENAEVYAQAWLVAMADMGPGEMTTNADVLVYAYRHPAPGQGHPYSLTTRQTKAIIDSSDEVLDAAYILAGAVSPSDDTIFTEFTTPPVGGPSLDYAPATLVPRTFAFFPMSA